MAAKKKHNIYSTKNTKNIFDAPKKICPLCKEHRKDNDPNIICYSSYDVKDYPHENIMDCVKHFIERLERVESILYKHNFE